MNGLRSNMAESTLIEEKVFEESQSVNTMNHTLDQN